MTTSDDSIVLPISGDPPLVGRVAAAGHCAGLVNGVRCRHRTWSRHGATRWRFLRVGLSRADDPAVRRKAARRCLAPAIDARQLAEKVCAHCCCSNEEAGLAAYFVSHGASRGMLHQLFHLSHNVITRQRRRLGVRLGQGRPPLPDPATRDAIHRRWADLGRHEIEPCAGDPPAIAPAVRCFTHWWFYLRCSTNSTLHPPPHCHSGSQHERSRTPVLRTALRRRESPAGAAHDAQRGVATLTGTVTAALLLIGRPPWWRGAEVGHEVRAAPRRSV